MNGVVLAIEPGTAFHPLSRVVSRYALPAYSRPLIHWPVLSLLESGIRDIVLVLSGSASASVLELLGSGRDFGVGTLRYAVADADATGATALLAAREFLGASRFAVIAADAVFEDSIGRHVQSFAASRGGAQITLLPAGPEPPHRASALLDARGNVTGFVQRPAARDLTRELAPLHFFDGSVWETIERLQADTPDEAPPLLALLDAYLRRGELAFTNVDGWCRTVPSLEALHEAATLLRERESRAPFPKFATARGRR